MFANVSMPIRSQWIIPSKTDMVNLGLSNLYMHSAGHLLIFSPVLDTLHHHSHTVIRRYPLQSMENSLTYRLHGSHPDRPLLHIDAVAALPQPAAGYTLLLKARSSFTIRSVSSPHNDLHRILLSSIKTQNKISPRPNSEARLWTHLR